MAGSGVGQSDVTVWILRHGWDDIKPCDHNYPSMIFCNWDYNIVYKTLNVYLTSNRKRVHHQYYVRYEKQGIKWIYRTEALNSLVFIHMTINSSSYKCFVFFHSLVSYWNLCIKKFWICCFTLFEARTITDTQPFRTSCLSVAQMNFLKRCFVLLNFSCCHRTVPRFSFTLRALPVCINGSSFERGLTPHPPFCCRFFQLAELHNCGD